jgi:hypothetical protein
MTTPGAPVDQMRRFLLVTRPSAAQHECLNQSAAYALVEVMRAEPKATPARTPCKQREDLLLRQSTSEVDVVLAFVPREPLWALFTPDAITSLRRVSVPSTMLDFRLAVLAAGGLNPSYANRRLRAYKAAWEAYLVAAFSCGLFEGKDGIDLQARLTGIDDDNFRSALSECFAAWFLAGRLKLELEPRPEGQSGRHLEFAIRLRDSEIKVEVKAPSRPITSDFWRGDDADLLESALQQANRQFRPGDSNLLVVVPHLRLPIFDVGDRRPIERAFIGETLIQIPIDTRTGGPAGPERLVFKQSGSFAKSWRSGLEDDRTWKRRFTRVGAALFLNEYIHDSDGGIEMRHRALIVHNPHALVPVPRDFWSGIPEFFCDAGRWRWSDVNDG